MRTILRNALKKTIPLRLRPYNYLVALVQRRTQKKVAKGIFTGMRYLDSSVSSVYIPKLLGIYEQELTHVMEQIQNAGFKKIIDIGSAEGYYAVGLAMRIPSATVIAFEMDEGGRTLLSQMAAMNNVSDRITIQAKCEPESLRFFFSPKEKTVVICDTEGYEMLLMDISRVPELVQAWILIELHEFIIPGITEVLKLRFQETHEVIHIWQEERTIGDFPYWDLYTKIMPRHYLELAVSEWRHQRTSWLWMQPRATEVAGKK